MLTGQAKVDYQREYMRRWRQARRVKPRTSRQRRVRAKREKLNAYLRLRRRPVKTK